MPTSEKLNHQALSEPGLLNSWFESLSFSDPLLGLALVIVIGIVGGELFGKFHLPKVTGWIVSGIILRQIPFTGLNPEAIREFSPLMSFVLGFIAFTVGATLYLKTLRSARKRIGLLLIGEMLITPTVVALILIFIGGMITDELGVTAGLLLAAIAIAGAPGTTVLVMQEVRARGIMTRTLLAAVGLIDMVAVGAFVFISSFLADELGWLHSSGWVAFQFGLSLLVGGFWACLALILSRTIISPAFQGPIMVTVILGTWGTAIGAGLSGILACTFAGIVVTNLRHESVRSTEAYMKSISGVLFAGFFTLAGMKLDFTLVPQAFGIICLFFSARMLGKYTSAYLAMAFSGMSRNIRNYLGTALMPHGGVAVGLIILVQETPQFENIQAIVTTVGLSALAINQLIGPSAARFALQRAGEAEMDRNRLLDFLGEEQIVTDISAKSIEEVVRHLATVLYSVENFPVDKEDYIAQVLERENVESTFLAEGLMIPYAILPNANNKVTGVLGLSRKGLTLNANEEYPIHAVLLLATPESEKTHHLEVLSSFATAITKDVNLREQLYHARNPSHAYQILHSEEQEELNYFLEDAFERAGMLDHS